MSGNVCTLPSLWVWCVVFRKYLVSLQKTVITSKLKILQSINKNSLFTAPCCCNPERYSEYYALSDFFHLLYS
ncbi:putative signal peptide protein [Puccinia sorghi]|uniref:Putative signal peptide protein n=1 Tax=Puccinia sorghi TaxID=27349 RepID=A0A0L6VQN7_9BASI|nr:putative signal peptide protein [Puccinia sorghi]